MRKKMAPSSLLNQAKTEQKKSTTKGQFSSIGVPDETLILGKDTTFSPDQRELVPA